MSEVQTLSAIAEPSQSGRVLEILISGRALLDVPMVIELVDIAPTQPPLRGIRNGFFIPPAVANIRRKLREDPATRERFMEVVKLTAARCVELTAEDEKSLAIAIGLLQSFVKQSLVMSPQLAERLRVAVRIRINDRDELFIQSGPGRIAPMRIDQAEAVQP